MGKEEKVFREEMMFSLDELMDSLALCIAHIREENVAPSARAKKERLYSEFAEKLCRCKLPTLQAAGWFYDYEYTGTAMELWLRFADGIVLDPTGRFIAEMSFGDEQLLIRIEDEWLTVEEFAAVHEAAVPTVRRWLKKGQLPFARKEGGSWLIPAAAERPDRESGTLQYAIDPDDPPLVEGWPMLRLCDSLLLVQEKKNSKRHECYFFNRSRSLHEKVSISKEEREELAYALLLSGKARPDPPPMWKPLLRKRADDQ